MVREIRTSDILHFAVNRTAEGYLRITDYDMLSFLHDHGNALILGLFEENVCL